MSNLSGFSALLRGTRILQTSDLDLIVDFSEPVGMFKFLELQDYLRLVLNTDVDLTTPRALKPAIKQTVERDVLYVWKKKRPSFSR